MGKKKGSVRQGTKAGGNIKEAARRSRLSEISEKFRKDSTHTVKIW